MTGNEEEGGSDQESTEEVFVMERRFPSLEQQAEDSESNSPGYRGLTIRDIISQRYTPGFYIVGSFNLQQ